MSPGGRHSAMRRRSFLALTVCAALALAAPVVALAAKAGARAPEFELKGLDGKTVRLSSLKGKVVLVDFWASWCKPCKKELPALDKLAKQYKDAGKDVVFVAINIDTDRAKAEKFLKEKGIKHVVVLLDPSSTSAEAYQPGTMPTSYVVDQKGIIKFVNEGYNPGDEGKLKGQIDGLLK